MIFAKNKKANFDYFIENKYEAGIELKGTEVKSIRASRLSIKEAFVRIIKNELWIMNMNISLYEFGNINNSKENRVRKLLMRKAEIEKLNQKIKEKGYTLVPLTVYSSGKFIKVEIALAKGKKNYDKRESLKQRDIKLELSMKN